MENLKVIFHIDEMDKWDMVLANAKNFYEGSENSKIAVLANGEAVKELEKNYNYEDELNMLSGWDIEFLACNNALEKFHIKADNLMSFIEVVPAGVVEIVKRQNEGYRYIKP